MAYDERQGYQAAFFYLPCHRIVQTISPRRQVVMMITQAPHHILDLSRVQSSRAWQALNTCLDISIFMHVTCLEGLTLSIQ